MTQAEGRQDFRLLIYDPALKAFAYYGAVLAIELDCEMVFIFIDSKTHKKGHSPAIYFKYTSMTNQHHHQHHRVYTIIDGHTPSCVREMY